MAAKVTRPQTIREIQAKKQTALKVGEITLMNVAQPPQLIIIHLKPPKGVDFYLGAQDVHLPRCGSKYTFKKNRIIPGQIERLQKQQKIQVVSQTNPADS